MIPMRRVSEEVFYTDTALTTVGPEELELLKREAQRTRRKRIRLCAHADVAEAVHEMVIVHSNEAYVCPHKHLKKSESYHVIEGLIDVVVFNEAGQVTEVTRIGESGSGEPVYCRISDDVFHSLLIVSAWVVFHETTSGPFRKTDTIYAPWAPAEEDPEAVRRFLEQLQHQLGGMAGLREGRIGGGA